MDLEQLTFKLNYIYVEKYGFKLNVQVCKYELQEIENCPDCYLNAHVKVNLNAHVKVNCTIIIANDSPDDKWSISSLCEFPQKDTWFTEACRFPHPVVWAR